MLTIAQEVSFDTIGLDGEEIRDNPVYTET